MSVELHLGDCLEVMRSIPDKSVDAVITDPPYLYLNHKLDRPFDEDVYFPEVKRILKPSGFYVSFGRGESFYRWGAKLSEMGFVFKEEIIWDKSYPSAPMHSIARCHETVFIWAVKTGKINRVKNKYEEAAEFDLDKMQRDLKRIQGLLKKPELLNEFENFLEEKKQNQNLKILDSVTKIQAATKHKLSTSAKNYNVDRTILPLDQMINGVREKTIIKIPANHFNSEHPTQKPVRLIERLMALVSSPDMVIFDPFAGSGSTGVACIQTGRNFIGCEIDPEYYAIAERRINEALAQPRLEFN